MPRRRLRFGAYEGAYQLLSRIVVDFPFWTKLPNVLFTSASILRRLGQLDACATLLLCVQASVSRAARYDAPSVTRHSCSAHQ